MTLIAPTVFSDKSVLYSSEFARIDALPRRRWGQAEAEQLARDLTERLKTPNGEMTLFPVQAVALYEAWVCGGLFASMSVSAGKTLLSLLLPRVMRAQRPVLLVPAKLVHKTKVDSLRLAKHWVFGTMPEIVSYETLGPKGAKNLLNEKRPDLLILDEGHRVRNPQASRTRKVRHYLQANPHCKVCVMSGTTIKRAIADYAHLIEWALRGNAPVPHRPDILEEWDCALGEKLALGLNRIQPGALLTWCSRGEIDEYGLLNAARRGYQRRLAETPGVICYHVAAEEIDCDITIRGLPIQHSPAVLDAFATLRTKWELPDGQELVEGCEIYRHARTLALGFYLRWKKPAPPEWLARRRAFGSFIREKLKGSRHYDSPDEVKDAYIDEPEVQDWLEIRDKYKPETTIVWIDGGTLQSCREWLRGGGIVWVETVAFGEALAQIAGVPYFGAGGSDARGQSIEAFQGRSCVASISANGEGRNLQRFTRMLVTAVLPNGPGWEQLIGRLHRIGQAADQIWVDVLIGCKEHVQPFWQSVRDAELQKHGDGGDPKLLLADIDLMGEGDMPTGHPWGNVAIAA